MAGEQIMVQRQSEGFHKGVTDSERAFALHLQRNHIGYLSQHVFCLNCGANDSSMGTVCLVCEKELRNSIAVVDFFIKPLKLIIEIIGSIHDKLKVENWDNYRKQKLIGLGYKVIEYRNEEVKKLIKL